MLEAMEQAVELSDALVVEAQRAGELDGRSVANQIECWVSLGRVVDSILGAERIRALQQCGAVKSLSECLMEVETEAGRQKVQALLCSGPFPRFEAAEGKPGWLLRTEEDGSQRIGRFVGRRFVDYPYED